MADSPDYRETDGEALYAPSGSGLRDYSTNKDDAPTQDEAEAARVAAATDHAEPPSTYRGAGYRDPKAEDDSAPSAA